MDKIIIEKLEGLKKHYWRGVLFSQGIYKNGKKVGLWKYFLPSGQIISKRIFNLKDYFLISNEKDKTIFI